MSTRLVALAGLVAVVALTGCGGGGGAGGGERLTKDEYQQRVSSLGDRLEQEFSDIATAGEDPDELPALMNRLGEALDALADGLDELTPPEDVEEEQARVVDAARATADESRAIAKRIERETLAELAKTPEELDISKSESFLEMQEAMNAIKAKGYDFGDSFGG